MDLGYVSYVIGRIFKMLITNIWCFLFKNIVTYMCTPYVHSVTTYKMSIDNGYHEKWGFEELGLGLEMRIKCTIESLLIHAVILKIYFRNLKINWL